METEMFCKECEYLITLIKSKKKLLNEEQLKLLSECELKDIEFCELNGFPECKLRALAQKISSVEKRKR
ncbi:MAG: hypothetical protein ACYDEC_16335 [Bacteroidia bacterium]